jgi:peptidoglycan/xylan/chitin deacetylase (PgdA/CDA1 family)
MTIFCYHSVESGWESPLAVEPDAFDRQTDWIRKHRNVLPLDEALRRLDRSGRLPSGEAALTFDDGFSALYDHLLPVLTRTRLPATVFVVAQTLTPGGQEVDWVDTPGTKPLSTLSADQILEMQDAGVDFQSHSWAHLRLPQLSEAECVTDLRDSRELLSDLLGRHVTLLAYPRGLHSPHVRRAAERAGYTHAFALPEGREEPGDYAVPRVGIYRGNGQTALRIKAARPYLPLRTDDRLAGAARRAKRAVRALRRRPSH